MNMSDIEVMILPLSTILIFDFGTVTTVQYSYFHIIHYYNQSVTITAILSNPFKYLTDVKSNF